MRYAIIENNVVVNVEEHDPTALPPNAIGSATATIGDAWDGQGFVSPPPPPSTPDQVSAAIRARLESIDAKSVRPLRAILAAQAAGLTPDPADMATLADLKAQADTLRAGLAT